MPGFVKFDITKYCYFSDVLINLAGANTRGIGFATSLYSQNTIIVKQNIINHR